ncbi:MAG: YHYH protein [Deltaproteobacteria bacterium]|nr:YHYH protein [Deltaproteobacteria bacterium]
MKRFFPWMAAALAIAVMTAILGCGCENDDDGDTLDDDASGDDDALEPCDVEPICSAFSNDGSEGGFVEVGLSSDGEYVVVRSNGLADHAMGPFGIGPGEAVEQDQEFQIPIVPSFPDETETHGGAIAVLYNGLALYDPWDYVETGGCRNNALVVRAASFDDYEGHPQQSGQYHHHTGGFLRHAGELGLTHSASEHSQLLGYSFDGFPIYGPYGYADPDDAGSGIKRLEPCYFIKAERDCCTDEDVCGTGAAFDGVTLTMGAFIEDYEYDAGDDCDLNEYNMRFQVTPEYPTASGLTFSRSTKTATPSFRS